MIRSRIIGTGSFLPETVLTNADLETMVDTTDAWIRQRTGISERHTAQEGEGTSDLALPAAQAALESARISPEELDLIICCTICGDYIFPATACLIQDRLGASKAGAFDLNAACSGFMYGLTTADAYIRSGLYKTVLVVCAERVVNRLNWNKRDTAVLFGDGAGAIVLRAEEGERGVLSTYLGSDGSGRDILILPGGGSKHKPTVELLGTEMMDIQMKGSELFKKAVVVFGEAAKVALDRAGVTVDEVDVFVPHQANNRIISSAAERVGLPLDKIVINIDKVGNTVAASIPLALDEAVRDGRVKDGALVLMASFGAGLTWGSALVRW
jgi:3-oxoacyl-[acyl-carrier-protein] synthase III